MSRNRSSVAAWLGRGVLLGALGLLGTGCATQSLNQARSQFYSGELTEAEASLAERDPPRRDRVLFLMERGTIRQALGEFESSSEDFIRAFDYLVELERYSISRGAGSLLINDNIRDFVGYPYERTLLHAMTAHNHFSIGNWDNAAIEARRIIASLAEDNRGNFPDEPYSRYLAGLALELIDDPSNAALQYRLADEAAAHLNIDADTGRISYAPPPAPDSNETNETERVEQIWPQPRSEPAHQQPPDWTHELVVGLQFGRAPGDTGRLGHRGGAQPGIYAEIYIDGQYAGRTYPLTDIAYLRAETERIRALRDAARAITRIVIKEGIAQAVESKNDAWAGDLVRFILFGLLEQPDTRRWETLPRWFHIGRVHAPADLDRYTVKVKTAEGRTLRTFEVENPMHRRRQQWVSFHRDLGR